MTACDYKLCLKSLWLGIILSSILTSNSYANNNRKKAYGIVDVEVSTGTRKIEKNFDVVNDFIWNGFLIGWHESFKSDEVMLYLKSNFGAAVSVSVKVLTDLREPDEKYELTEIVFKGINIRLASPLNSETTWIEKISVSSDIYKIKHGLKIGASKQTIIDKLGSPRSEFNGALVYFYWGDTLKVIFSLDSNKNIKEILWEDYTD